MITRSRSHIPRSFKAHIVGLRFFIVCIAFFLVKNPVVSHCFPAGEQGGAGPLLASALPGGIPGEGPAAGSGADSTVHRGRTIFLKNCAGCHGEQGQGTAGPNLTDRYWLHGGGVKNVSAAIREGVSGKGMIGWKALFSGGEIQDITGYVLSLQGTNPPKGKKPEGVPYHEAERERPKGK